jgi:hypothetical protein
MENVLSYFIILLILIYILYDENNRGVVGILLISLIIVFYGYIWHQKYDVYPTQGYETKNYKNRMLWINTDKLDVTSSFHKKWGNYIMMDCAPNKLGIYVDKEVINKIFVLKQLETFKIMFGYNCPIIYFKITPNKIVMDFLRKKGVEIVRFSFRYTL